MIRTFADGLFTNIVSCYRRYMWAWHVLAALLTALLVLSGFDWWFFEHTRAVPEWFVLMAGIGGFFVPVLTAVGLYWAGHVRGANVAAQATIIAWLISSAYKAFTGRLQPEFLTHVGTSDISREFHFGFWQHGIFWGWPSSHAATAAALATGLYLLYKAPLPRTALVLYAATIATGAAVGFHWFSDALAGTIIGVLVGYTVARYSSSVA